MAQYATYMLIYTTRSMARTRIILQINVDYYKKKNKKLKPAYA